MGLEVKNPLRAQSKYDLMGSSAKTGNSFIGGSQEQKRCTFCVQNTKVSFGIGHPHLHIKPNLHVCRRVQGHKSSNRIELCQDLF